MTESDFKMFLAGISYRAIINKNYFDKILSMGIYPDQWIDCPAKTLFQEFIFLNQTKGRDFAELGCAPRAKNLMWQDVSEFSDLDLKTKYFSNAKKLRAIETAKKIVAAPLEIEKIFAEFSKASYTSGSLISMKSVIEEVMKKQAEKVLAKDAIVVLPKFPLLSEAIGGFNPQRVSLLSAASGFGKTKLALNLVESAEKVMKTIYFNMEMGLEDFVASSIQQRAGITNRDWNTGAADFSMVLEKVQESFGGADLLFTDGISLTLDSIISSIFSSFDGSKMFVVVDYDQKISYSSGEEEWMFLVRAMERLENVAKSCNAHIMVLCQADDLGDIKASKRAKQPASAVLNFYSEPSTIGHKYYLKSIKNRFGAPFCLEVDFAAAMSRVSEVKFVQPPTAKKYT